jgi:hypothetical protein
LYGEGREFMHLALSVPQKSGPKAVAMSSRQSVRESRSGSQAEIWFMFLQHVFFKRNVGQNLICANALGATALCNSRFLRCL